MEFEFCINLLPSYIFLSLRHKPQTMNFLAHIYLSGPSEGVILGNFMADGIRGKDYLQFPTEIQKGILLHRFIDTFTDAHPTFRLSKHRLHDKYGHYAGVITDILYDHFLAKNWERYHPTPLEMYADSFYELLLRHYELLTERTQKMFPYMKARNWLVSYASLEGLEMILFQMQHRTQHRVPMKEAIADIETHYDTFQQEFESFFEEIQLACQEKLQELSLAFPSSL